MTEIKQSGVRHWFPLRERERVAAVGVIISFVPFFCFLLYFYFVFRFRWCTMLTTIIAYTQTLYGKYLISWIHAYLHSPIHMLCTPMWRVVRSKFDIAIWRMRHACIRMSDQLTPFVSATSPHTHTHTHKHKLHELRTQIYICGLRFATHFLL